MRLIDAEKLWLTTEYVDGNDHSYYEQFEVVNAPTVEAEPVIRCKDCKYFGIADIEGFTINGKPLRYAVCKHKNGMRGITVYAYCSRAERKNDEVN